MVLSWGRPIIIIKKVGTNVYKQLPPPVLDSTNLTTTKGEKKEAKIEGGENEDVKYTRNTYALALDIRQAKGRTRPINDEDGLIVDNYEVYLQPEDSTTEGFKIAKSTVSVEDSWTSADGGVLKYTFDALKPDDGGKQVQWGVVTITKDTEGNITGVTVTPVVEEEEEEEE